MYNELYKIFKRKRTIIPFAVIAVLIIGLGWVTVKYLEPETKGWKADYTERTVEIERKARHGKRSNFSGTIWG